MIWESLAVLVWNFGTFPQFIYGHIIHLPFLFFCSQKSLLRLWQPCFCSRYWNTSSWINLFLTYVIENDRVIFMAMLYLYFNFLCFLAASIFTIQILIFHFPLKDVIIDDMSIFNHVESMPYLASTHRNLYADFRNENYFLCYATSFLFHYAECGFKYKAYFFCFISRPLGHHQQVIWKTSAFYFLKVLRVTPELSCLPKSECQKQIKVAVICKKRLTQQKFQLREK